MPTTTQPDEVHQTATWEVRQIKPVERSPWPRFAAVLAVCLVLLLSNAVSAHVTVMVTGVADLFDLRRAVIHSGDRNGLNPR